MQKLEMLLAQRKTTGKNFPQSIDGIVPQKKVVCADCWECNSLLIAPFAGNS